jgi:hypothetical protein
MTPELTTPIFRDILWTFVDWLESAVNVMSDFVVKNFTGRLKPQNGCMP